MGFGLGLIERETIQKEWMKEYKFILIQSMDHLKEVLARAIEAPYCAFDLESTGLDTRIFNGACVNQVVGYSIAFEPKVCYYIPIRHKVETNRGKNLPPREVNPLIQDLINSTAIIGHNWMKFDSEMMWAAEGITLNKFRTGELIPHHDTYILARLAGFKPAGLKHLSKKLLNKEMIEIKEVVSSKQKDIDFGSVSPYEGCIYAASDALCTMLLYEQDEIQAPIKEQTLIYNMERKIPHVVRKMERNKIKLDLEFCKKLDMELSTQIKEIEHEAHRMVCEKTNGKVETFKLDSPADVSYVLFHIYDMNPKPEKGKTGNYKTDDSVLESLAGEYELAKKLQEYRTLTKFQRTYTRNMLKNVDQDGYLKFNFSALQTDSGRFASPGGGKNGDGCSGVNIQAIPARYDKSKPNIRKCISCDDDEVICALDWSGVEIRVAANMSNEPIWLERFLNGDGDVHTATAAIIYDKPEWEVTKAERQNGKTFNFQSIYGGSAGSLAIALGIDMEEAKDKQGRFFGVLKTLKSWIRGLQRFSRKHEYCLTKFGRKRMLPEYQSEFPKIQRSGDRKAVNTPVQGTAADLLKLAMIKINDYLDDNDLNDHIQMIITMHDELVFRVKKTHVDKVKEIEKVMQLESFVEKIGWRIPLKVDVEIGSSWDVTYEYDDMATFLKETYDVDTVTYIYESDKDYDAIFAEFEKWMEAKKEAKKNKIISNEKPSPKEEFKKLGKELHDKSQGKDIHTKAAEELVKAEIPTEIIKKEDKKSIETADVPVNQDEAGQIRQKAMTSVFESLYGGNGDREKTPLETKTLQGFKRGFETEIVDTIENKIELSCKEEEEEVSSLEDTSASAVELDQAFKLLKSANLGDLPLEAHATLKKSFYREEFERILSGSPSFSDEGIEFDIVVHNPIDDAKKNSIGYIIDSCPGKGKVRFLTQDREKLHDGWVELDVIKAAVLSKTQNL